LRELSGVAGFYAGQVVADCKFFAPLSNAPDVMTFAVSGPGSRRGLARVLGRPIKSYEGNEARWQRDFNILRTQLAPEIEQIFTPDNEADRAIGKVCDLAFGYGGGLGAYRKFDASDARSDAEVEQLKNAWRAAHFATTRLWYAIDNATKRAIRGWPSELAGDKLKFAMRLTRRGSMRCASFRTWFALGIIFSSGCVRNQATARAFSSPRHRDRWRC
jgi:hypothetical protein